MWMAYYQVEPFGPEVDSFQAAQICSTIANVMSGKKGKQYKPADFMPTKAKASIQTPEDQLKFVERLNRMMGGIDKRKKK